MNKQILNTLENNWDNLKDQIQTQWKKLTDEDMQQISGSYERLIAKLKKAYYLKPEVIEDEVSDFLANNNLVQQIAEKTSKSVDLPAIKAAISDHLEDYVNYIKAKSHTLETTTKKHVRENPIKWLSVAALSGFVLGKFLRF